MLYNDDLAMTWVRERFLRELVSGRLRPKADLQEKMSRLSVNPYFTFPAVALVEPVAKREEGTGARPRAEAARDAVQQEACAGSVAFVDDEDRVALLFSWTKSEMLEKLQRKLSDRFGCSVNIGVGRPCGQLGDVHQSYGQASTALRYKFYKGTGQVLYANNLRPFEPVRSDPEIVEKTLYDTLKAAVSHEEIEEAVEHCYESVLQNRYLDIESLYEWTIRLLLGIEKRMLADEKDASAYHSSDILSVIRLETLDEMKRYVSQFLQGLWEFTLPNQKESHRSIIKKSLHYMESEYGSASLQSIARKVYMTPAYLSLLFKANTGKTFIEHLTDIRIGKAKEMLASTHYKNYEVAEKVGYHDSRYFSQIFKKKVGVSPSEYRESAAK